MPKYEQTPGEINIPTILWLRNLALAYDMSEYSKTRYNLLENGGHWFPGSTAKNSTQYDLSECLQNSPHKEEIPRILQECEQLLGGAKVKRLSES